MRATISLEAQLQNNTINLLKAMGYEFITQEENVRLRYDNLNEVVLKDILNRQLQKINSFDYKGVGYKFSLEIYQNKRLFTNIYFMCKL